MTQDRRHYTLCVERLETKMNELDFKDYIRDNVRDGKKGVETMVHSCKPNVNYPKGSFAVAKAGEEKARKIFEFLSSQDYPVHLWETTTESPVPHSCNCDTVGVYCKFYSSTQKQHALAQRFPAQPLIAPSASSRANSLYLSQLNLALSSVNSVHLPYHSAPRYSDPSVTKLPATLPPGLVIRNTSTQTYKSIFIKNLHPGVNLDMLEGLFKSVGTIMDSKLHARYNRPNKFNGTATITFSFVVEALAAIAAFDNKTCFGRRIRVCLDDPGKHTVPVSTLQRRGPTHNHIFSSSWQEGSSSRTVPAAAALSMAALDKTSSPAVSHTLTTRTWSVDSGVSMISSGIALPSRPGSAVSGVSDDHSHTEAQDDEHDDDGDDSGYETERDGPIIVDGR